MSAPYNFKGFFFIPLVLMTWLKAVSQSKEVIYKEVNEHGLIGYIALPDTQNKFPAIISLKGSGGGLSTFHPKLLGGKQYVVLSLAYSGMGHLPKSEKELPLEYFEKAVLWLKKHPNVDSTKLGIIGTSLGAETALSFASRFPVFKAVISVVGSHVVWQYSELGMTDTVRRSHFTYRGEPLPFVPLKLTKDIYQNGLKSGLWGEMFVLSLKDTVAVQKAEIEVEKINAAILLLSGADDAIWPSKAMSDAIINRLKKHNYPFEYLHVAYPETGHMLYVTKDGKTGGGSGRGAQFADEDSQKQIIAFFNRHLKSN